MFDGSDLLSYINQDANGTYETGQFPPGIWTGAASATVTGNNTSTCSDWTSGNGQPPTSGLPNVTAIGTFWSGFPNAGNCSFTLGVLCLQQVVMTQP